VLRAAPPVETRQYCHNDVFRAECASGHVILVTSALYGRMALGRCVKTDFGFIGCKVDVIGHWPVTSLMTRSGCDELWRSDWFRDRNFGLGLETEHLAWVSRPE